MKKSWIFIGWIAATIIIALLIFRPIEKPKKIETAQNQPSTPIPAPLPDVYKLLPDEIFFCQDHIILDENKKRTLADVMDAEIKNFSSENIRLIHNNMWFYYIRNELRAANLHDDLRYVSITESRLDPLAESGMNAIGPWQLMVGTARRLGLTVILGLYDERLDFVKSTQAATDYLRELHGKFGNWSATLAGYNTGEENLRKAMEAERTRDFFQLQTIHPETKVFPFRVIATKLIFENPEKYGFTRQGWLSESTPEEWRIMKICLTIDEDWAAIPEIVQRLKDDYPEWDSPGFEDRFKKYNPHLLDDFLRGEYWVYLVEKNGTS